MPVRDYVERGIPLMSAVSAMAQAALGAGLRAEVHLVAAAFAVAAALVYVAAALISGSALVGIAAAVLTVAVHPVSYSYPKLLAYGATFLVGLCYAGWPSSFRLAALASMIVVSFLLRHDHGIFLGLGSIALLLAVHGARQAAAVTAAFVVYGLVFAGPYVAWVQAYEGVTTYVADGVAFSRREAARSARFDLPAFGLDRSRPLFSRVAGGPVVNVRWAADIPDRVVVEREETHGLTRLDTVGERTWRYELSRWSASALEELVRDRAVADTHGIDRSRFRLTDADPGLIRRLLIGKPWPDEGLRVRANALAALFYLAWGMPLIAGGALLVWWSRVAGPIRGIMLMAIAVQLMLNVTMLRDPIDLRVRDVVVPMVIMLAFVAGRSPAGHERRMLGWMVRVAGISLLGVGLAAAAALGPAGERLAETGVFGGTAGLTRRTSELRDEFRPPAQRTGALSDAYRRLVDYVTSCTPPDARLLVMAFAPELFFYTNRGFAGGQVTLTPGYYTSGRHATLILDRLSRESVPLVVVDSEIEGEVRQQHPRVFGHVVAAYHRVAEFPISGPKRFIVLAENRRESVREFGPERLPCYVAPAAGAAKVEGPGALKG